MPVILAQSLSDAVPAAVAAADAASRQNSLVCKIFPFLGNINFFGISALCGGQDLTVDDVSKTGTNLVQTIVSFIFVAIIIIAVYIIIKAAIKYIRSEGNEEKIQEAQKAIKSVFIGLVALFVGIIGLVLILVIFNALGAVQNNDVNTNINELQTN